MKDLDHPNVMKLIGICWGKKVDLDDSAPVGCGPLIVLPYIEMGDLHGYLRSKRRVAFGSISSYSNILSVSLLMSRALHLMRDVLFSVVIGHP